ncbi:unnamed protein product [Ophioblennius macclurei]
MMMKTLLGFVLLGLVASTTAAAPGSCSGRCGESFTRGKLCKCDFNCLQHNECCQDFEAVCTTARSCQGRCGEAFKRGQLCECDPLCAVYNTCCQDHQQQCEARVSAPRPNTLQPQRASTSGIRIVDSGRKRSNSASEEWYTVNRRCSQYPGGRCPSASGLKPLTVQTLQHGLVNAPAGSGLPVNGAPVNPSGSGGRVNIQLVLSPRGHEVASSGMNHADAVVAGPSTLQDVAQALGFSVVDGGFQAPGAGPLDDVNLCSNSPINGITALGNGTILIFKGEFFWAVDPVSRLVGRPQSITDTLGVASPIDTVFTRPNCQRNTYIIKGDQYWRLDGNLVLEPGYPKPLAYEFPGLTGGINAALAVPATSSRAETVFFFRNGDIMQRFTFPAASVPPCARKPQSSSMRRVARQAEVLLSGDINVKVALKGCPTPITSALSLQSRQTPDVYEYYVFSGPLFFRIQILGDMPAMFKPEPSAVLAPQPIFSPAVVPPAPVTDAQNPNPNPLLPANSIIVWLRCP